MSQIGPVTYAARVAQRIFALYVLTHSTRNTVPLAIAAAGRSRDRADVQNHLCRNVQPRSLRSPTAVVRTYQVPGRYYFPSVGLLLMHSAACTIVLIG